MRLREVVDTVTAEEPPLSFSLDDIVARGRKAQQRRRAGFAAATTAGLAAVAAAVVFVLPSPSGRQSTPILPGEVPTSTAPAPEPTTTQPSAPPTTPSSLSTSGAAKASHSAANPDAMTPFSPGAYDVQIHSYNATKHTLVVEQVKLGSGDQFCADNGIKAADCPPNLAIVGLKSTYTLPVATDVKVNDIGGGNPDCVGNGDSEFSKPGKCPAPAGYLKQQTRNPGWLVQIKTNADSVYEINELYQP